MEMGGQLADPIKLPYGPSVLWPETNLGNLKMSSSFSGLLSNTGGII